MGQSGDSREDSDVINCMWSTIDFHLDSGHDISAAFPCIRSICEHVLSHYSKYDITEKIYADLRPRYEGLRHRIGEPDAAPNGGPATQLGNSGATEGPPSVS